MLVVRLFRHQGDKTTVTRGYQRCTLYFTAANGEPIMYALLFTAKAIKERILGLGILGEEEHIQLNMVEDRV